MEIFSDKEIIKEEWKEAILNHKYSGKDDSLYYKYFASDFSEFLLKFIPIWLAPNVITLIGLFCNITAYIICLYYTGLSGKAGATPAWAVHAVAFLYHTFFVSLFLYLPFFTLPSFIL